jgi:S1-C subfamily serine protease
VSKVESGTPAGRARINPNEIIQAVDGERIDSPAKFEAIVQRAQEQKKDQLRLTVVDRGRSRFADLKFTQ